VQSLEKTDTYETRPGLLQGVQAADTREMSNPDPQARS